MRQWSNAPSTPESDLAGARPSERHPAPHSTMKIRPLLTISLVACLAAAAAAPDAAAEPTCLGRAPTRTCSIDGRDNVLCVGSDESEIILGSGGADVIIGGGGDDQISAGPGPDLVCGGDGNDTIRGESGDDSLHGESGDDVLDGGAGTDLLRGGRGANLCLDGEDDKACQTVGKQEAAEVKAAASAAEEALAEARIAREEAARATERAEAAEREAAERAREAIARSLEEAVPEGDQHAGRKADTPRKRDREAARGGTGDTLPPGETDQAEKQHQAQQRTEAQTRAKAEAANREKAEAQARARAEALAREEAERQARLRDAAELAALARTETLGIGDPLPATAPETGLPDGTPGDSSARADGFAWKDDPAVAAPRPSVPAASAGKDGDDESGPAPTPPPTVASSGTQADERLENAPPARTASTVTTDEADLKVGLVIDALNVDAYAAFLSPAIAWVVANGVDLEVGPYKIVRNPPPFIEATERYADQVRLADDATHLINHVAGLPFPRVDPADRNAATRLMFNFNAAIARDDLDLRNFECNTGQIGNGGSPVRVERTFVVGHLRRLFFTERTSVEPIPEMHPNKDGVRYKEALYPLLEPFDLKGVGFTYNRYLDHTRQDDSWLYLPQLRRLRRLSSSQRSDALFGQDTDQDSFAGYAGNVGWFDWKLLGEKTVLATFHEAGIPVDWGSPSGDYIHKGTWEPRKAWVVEGVSKLPDYAYSRRVIYLDKESWRIPYSDLYDRDGQLWKVWVNSFKFATHPFPGARYGFDYEIPYEPSISMVDIQARHATYCSLPGRTDSGEQGWYVNLGDREGTVESFFDLSTMISGGR